MAWEVDLAHTQVAFAIRHLGVSMIRGNMHVSSANLELDEAHPESTSLRATIDVNTLNTRDPSRDGHLKTADFFNVAQYPNIEFATTKVAPGKGDEFEVNGNLTILGVTKPVTLKGKYAGPVDDPVSGKRKLGFEMEGDIRQGDWGIDWNVPMTAGGFMLSDRVRLTIDGQAIEAA
ncbi:MAG TPA: YceI family protein [Dehalococcoidia bacterium]|nr:YceI family protein [Dehalococcoidia bacterium]